MVGTAVTLWEAGKGNDEILHARVRVTRPVDHRPVFVGSNDCLVRPRALHGQAGFEQRGFRGDVGAGGDVDRVFQRKAAGELLAGITQTGPGGCGAKAVARRVINAGRTDVVASLGEGAGAE